MDGYKKEVNALKNDYKIEVMSIKDMFDEMKNSYKIEVNAIDNTFDKIKND